MLIGAVADIHGNVDALYTAFTRHPDIRLWICVGDLASRSGAYPEPPAPLYWIKGNNENFNRIAEWQAGAPQPRHLHYIPNGTAARVGPLTVAGLGGTYAPTWFDTAATELPRRAKDDRRRHFVREKVEACKQLEGVDIVMTHEAARPFLIVDPPLHLCGHHHRFSETEREGIRSVCIDRINRSDLLIDAGTMKYRKIDQ